MPPLVTDNPKHEAVGLVSDVLQWLDHTWMIEINELPRGERGKIHSSPLALVFLSHGWEYVRMGSRTMTLGMGVTRTRKIELPWFVRQFIRAYDKGWAHESYDSKEPTEAEAREAEYEYLDDNIRAGTNYRLVQALNALVPA